MSGTTGVTSVETTVLNAVHLGTFTPMRKVNVR